MSLGEVDTLNLLTDKLNNLFEESQGYYESFLDTNNMYKEGKLITIKDINGFLIGGASQSGKDFIDILRNCYM